MANQFLNIYKNNPTAGETDGTAVSTDGTFTSPLDFTLDASQNESAVQKCAIRSESGYSADNVTITDKNDTNDRLSFCETAGGSFADSVTFDEVGAVNQIFYVKASSSDDENPTTDKSVSLKVIGTIRAD